MDLTFLLALLAFSLNCWASISITAGLRKMRSLHEVQPLKGLNQPKVTIITAACNEEKSIEQAARSLLMQDYANLEVIIVNDRSTDNTGEALVRLQQEFPQLRIHNITELPEGWLGKNNALHRGAALASGEYLLFTDADVIIEQSALSRAVFYSKENLIDHLSLFFKNIAPGALLNSLIMDAGGGLLFLFQPWKARDPASPKFMGVGAFNLLKKSVYDAVGGHATIRMHPIDDIMLGKIIKRKGFRQDCLLGRDFVTVRWYESVGKMVEGLMKNVFALYDFRISYVLFAVLVILIGAVSPLWLVVFGHANTKIISALALAARFISFSSGAKAMGTPAKISFWPLITPYINIYIIFKATIKTIRDKGIYWRGTFYPLDQLRKNAPLL